MERTGSCLADATNNQGCFEDFDFFSKKVEIFEKFCQWGDYRGADSDTQPSEENR